MKAKLKGIYSIDLPGGPPELPPDPEDCWVVIQADIGAVEADAADEFTFYVCTPGKLTRLLGQKEYVFGRHVLIVRRFDWQTVEDAISAVCEQVQGQSWEEIASQLNTYGRWEFGFYADG